MHPNCASKNWGLTKWKYWAIIHVNRIFKNSIKNRKSWRQDSRAESEMLETLEPSGGTAERGTGVMTRYSLHLLQAK